MTQQENKSVESQTRKTSGNQQPDRQALTREPRQRQNALSPYGFGMSPGDLLRMNPFAIMRRMGEEIDRMFTGSDSRSGGAWMPAIEVSQQGGNYKISADLPGIDPNNVKVEIENNAIVLEGEREWQTSGDEGGMHHSERRYGSFYRTIPLPEGAEPQQARARFENGVLEITVPVKEQAQQRRSIPVQSGASGSSATGAANASTAPPNEGKRT